MSNLNRQQPGKVFTHILLDRLLLVREHADWTEVESSKSLEERYGGSTAAASEVLVVVGREVLRLRPFSIYAE